MHRIAGILVKSEHSGFSREGLLAVGGIHREAGSIRIGTQERGLLGALREIADLVGEDLRTLPYLGLRVVVAVIGHIEQAQIIEAKLCAGREAHGRGVLSVTAEMEGPFPDAVHGGGILTV